jgi:hypothetical protein
MTVFLLVDTIPAPRQVGGLPVGEQPYPKLLLQAEHTPGSIVERDGDGGVSDRDEPAVERGVGAAGAWILR